MGALKLIRAWHFPEIMRHKEKSPRGTGFSMQSIIGKRIVSLRFARMTMHYV
jgi:hypothetical protein